MLYPELFKVKEKISITDAFTGIKASGRAVDGKLRDMENMSFEEFPYMNTRPERAVWTGVTYYESGLTGQHNGVHRFPGKGIVEAASVSGKFCFCSEEHLYINGELMKDVKLDASVEKRNIIGFGRNILVLPEGVYIKFSDNGQHECTDMRSEIAFSEVLFSFCNDLSEDVEIPYGFLPPEVPSQGDMYIERDGDELYLMRYGDFGTWERDVRLYVNIKAEGIGKFFSEGDRIVSDNDIFLKGTGNVICVSSDVITTDMIISSVKENAIQLFIKKQIPVFDFALEHNNRIWGCRYGEDINGNFVNEIYASALGEPLEWFVFEGTSMDSFSANLGCSGDFTGAVVSGNDILFFKEDYMIRVSGDSPSSFMVQTIPFMGVEKGSSKSIVRIGERIFYKSREGICVYDGAVPVIISKALGNKAFSDVCAGAVDGKYYAAMTDRSGNRKIYVFDTSVSFWRKESCENLRFIVNHDGCLFYVEDIGSAENIRLYRFSLWDKSVKHDAPDILGAFYERDAHVFVDEGEISWFFETGEIGENNLPDRQIIRSILVNATLLDEGEIRMYILPEGGREWLRLGVISAPHKGAFSIPVNTPPCHNYALKFEGKGRCVIHSVVRRSEIISEVKNVGRR